MKDHQCWKACCQFVLMERFWVILGCSQCSYPYPGPDGPHGAEHGQSPFGCDDATPQLNHVGDSFCWDEVTNRRTQEKKTRRLHTKKRGKKTSAAAETPCGQHSKQLHIICALSSRPYFYSKCIKQLKRRLDCVALKNRHIDTYAKKQLDFFFFSFQAACHMSFFMHENILSLNDER